MSEDAFLQAVLAEPDDPGPRLVWADWLEERGDPRGGLLRWSVDVLPALLAAAGPAPGEPIWPRHWPPALDRLVAAWGLRHLRPRRSHVGAAWQALDQPGRTAVVASELYAVGLVDYSAVMAALNQARASLSLVRNLAGTLIRPIFWSRHYHREAAERVIAALRTAGWPKALGRRWKAA